MLEAEQTQPSLLIGLIKFLDSAVYKIQIQVSARKHCFGSIEDKKHSTSEAPEVVFFGAVDLPLDPELGLQSDIEVKKFNIHFLKDLIHKYSNFFAVTVPIVDFVLEGVIQQSKI